MKTGYRIIAYPKNITDGRMWFAVDGRTWSIPCPPEWETDDLTPQIRIEVTLKVGGTPPGITDNPS
jgi:hypothetical protein